MMVAGSLMFDTHAHYDDEAFDKDREELLKSLAEHGIGLVVNPGADLKSSKKALELAAKYEFIYAAVGVHPHSASEFDLAQEQELCKLLPMNKVVALGEIGLDYHYDFSERSVQKAVFEKQLSMAKQAGLPVIIHEREASMDCFEIIKNSGITKGVYHCYSGSLETAKELVKLGFSLSFTGVITFKNAKKAADIIRWLPSDRIMIETDSPYLAPEPFRGKRNSSRLLIHVAEKIAEIRGIPVENVIKMTTDNGKAFFGIE